MGVCKTKNKEDDNEARNANVLCGFGIFSSLYHFPQHRGVTPILVLSVPTLKMC